MVTAKQIASWIVHYSWNDLGAPVDPMALEKMLYYAQAFHLVLRDTALFPDEILAWQKGPVVADVYKHYARFGWNSIVPDEEAPVTALPDTAERFVKQIVDFFGRYTAAPLSRATHLENPWADSRHDVDPDSASGNVISQMDIKNYYRALTEDGEVALSRQEMLGFLSEPRWGALYVAGICARRMISHPFYDAALAKKLSEAVPELPTLGKTFYSPPRECDFMEYQDGDTIDEMLKRNH